MASLDRLLFHVSGKLYSFECYPIWPAVLWAGVGNLTAGVNCSNYPVKVTMAISALYMASMVDVAVYLPAGFFG